MNRFAYADDSLATNYDNDGRSIVSVLTNNGNPYAPETSAGGDGESDEGNLPSVEDTAVALMADPAQVDSFISSPKYSREYKVAVASLVESKIDPLDNAEVIASTVTEQSLAIRAEQHRRDTELSIGGDGVIGTEADHRSRRASRELAVVTGPSVSAIAYAGGDGVPLEVAETMANAEGALGSLAKPLEPVTGRGSTTQPVDYQTGAPFSLGPRGDPPSMNARGQQVPNAARLFFNVRPNDRPSDNTRWVLFSNGAQWQIRSPDGRIRSPSGRYVFVQQNGTAYVERATKSGHVDLAQGSPVEYAGEIQFGGRRNRGALRWWNNNSGHFRPAPESHGQAQLPQDFSFRPHDPADLRRLPQNQPR